MTIRVKRHTREIQTSPVRSDDLELKGMGQFIGTEQYHSGFLGVNLTDGVAYISENGYSWFVTDVIAVIKTKLINYEFLVINLKLDGKKAKMIISDGNDKVLYTQNYDFTDAKREIHLYFQNNVMMLSSEY